MIQRELGTVKQGPKDVGKGFARIILVGAAVVHVFHQSGLFLVRGKTAQSELVKFRDLVRRVLARVDDRSKAIILLESGVYGILYEFTIHQMQSLEDRSLRFGLLVDAGEFGDELGARIDRLTEHVESARSCG